jgi:prepilin-type N-terminal cleavage/methylation domain-containing protein
MKSTHMHKIKRTRTLRHERGFTIVEVLIALTIFSIAVAGVITIAVQGGMNVNASKLTLTANYLADEGVELMRAMRDTSVVGATTTTIGWNAYTSVFGTTRCTVVSPCDIDPTIAPSTPSGPFPSINNVVNCAMYCSLYTYTSGPKQGYYSSTLGGSGVTLSPYRRQITVTPLSANEVRVIVKVQYNIGTVMQTVTSSENLYNWY